MNNEYVIMTIIEPPFPADPLPGEAIQLRVLDFACGKCRHKYDIMAREWRLIKCDLHENLNVLQSRRTFRELTQQQLELFAPEEIDLAQPVS